MIRLTNVSQAREGDPPYDSHCAGPKAKQYKASEWNADTLNIRKLEQHHKMCLDRFVIVYLYLFFEALDRGLLERNGRKLEMERKVDRGRVVSESEFMLDENCFSVNCRNIAKCVMFI